MTPQPTALNVEFQHFILRFNKIVWECRAGPGRPSVMDSSSVTDRHSEFIYKISGLSSFFSWIISYIPIAGENVILASSAHCCIEVGNLAGAVLLFSGYFNAQLHRFQIEESKYSLLGLLLLTPIKR